MNSLPPSDQVLALRALSGSEVAFSALFDRYFERVHAYVALRAARRAQVEHLTTLALEAAFADLLAVARGGDLAVRALQASRRAVVGTPSHAFVTQSPR